MSDIEQVIRKAVTAECGQQLAQLQRTNDDLRNQVKTLTEQAQRDQEEVAKLAHMRAAVKAAGVTF